MNTGGSARGKISIYDVAFIAGAMICVGLLAYKAFFSLGYDDESEIILNSLRFVRGDRMLVDDWHVSQLSSFFLYPFILAYHKLTGSAEGIVLFSRVVYVFVKTFVSAAAYITLRPYKKGAVAASLLFLIHEPVWTSLTIYYNTGLLLAGECLSLLLFSLDSGRARLKTYLIGVCCALCVVASPYTAVLFAGYTAAVTAAAVKGRIKKARGADGGKAAGFSLLTAKSWLTVSAGIATVALVFFAYLMRSNSFGEIVKNLPMVFYDDEYTAGVLSGFADLPVNMKRYLLHVASVIPVWASAAGAAVLIAAAVDRGRVRRRIIYIVPMFAVCLFGVVYPYASGDGAAGDRRYESLIFAAFGVLCYMLTVGRNKRVFRFLFVPGALMTILRTLESDIFFASGAMIAPVALTGAALMIADCFREIVKNAPSRAFSRCAAVFAALFFAVQFCYRFDNLRSPASFVEYEYGDSVTAGKMSERLGRGPMKGLFTTRWTARMYCSALDDLDLIASRCDGPVMVPDEVCWIYMYLDDMPMGSYSGYIVAENWVEFDSVKMRRYYERHPERYPSVIYIPYFTANYERKNPALREVVDSIRAEYPGEINKGRAGYIYYVSRGETNEE